MEATPVDYWADYLKWLRSQTNTSKIGGWTEIETPFLDRHNDHMQLYIRRDVDRIILSDDGYTLSDLAASGCDLKSPRRKELLLGMVNGFGVRLAEHGDAIIAEATSNNMAQKMHNLLQAMLAVNDMFLTSRSQVFQLFVEEVARFFDEYDIRYTPAVQLVGRSGMTFKADFVIPKSKNRPERIVNAINQPNKDTAKILLFGWQDVRETRAKDSHMLTILNDTVKPIPTDISSAFEEYKVRVIPWSQKENSLNELVA